MKNKIKKNQEKKSLKNLNFLAASTAALLTFQC